MAATAGVTVRTVGETPAQTPRDRVMLVVYIGEGAEATTRMVELPDGGELTVGRARSSTIHIESERVSRSHARIMRVGNHVWIEDLGSRNGTWVDGIPITEMRQLSSGSAIAIGPATIVLNLTTRVVARPRVHPLHYLEDRLAAEVDRGQSFDRVFSLIRLRLAGEPGALAEAIGRVAAATRRMDVVAEYSPNELAILVPELDARSATALARELVAAAHGRARDALEVMVGISGFPEHATTPDALIARAGEAVEAVRIARVDDVAIAPPNALGTGDMPLLADPQMQRVYELVRKVAAHPITVLVQGETGAGKEMVAAAIHRASGRTGPYIRLNCASMPETLLDSALFGHEKGAFTGADRQALGYFEAANYGTLFLDEVGELSPATQSKLLRVLEEHCITRVGGTVPIEVDVRVVCATHRDLEADAGRGSFRSDLFFRISAFTIFVPPLRDRRSEIVPLAEHFLARCHAANGSASRAPALSVAAADALQGYDWPGNVRELRNAIERAYVVHDNGVVELDDLPDRIVDGRWPASVAPAFALDGQRDVREHVAEIERDVIANALAACGGSQTEAAKKLGLTRRALIYRMEKHGLKPMPAGRLAAHKDEP